MVAPLVRYITIAATPPSHLLMDPALCLSLQTPYHSGLERFPRPQRSRFGRGLSFAEVVSFFLELFCVTRARSSVQPHVLPRAFISSHFQRPAGESFPPRSLDLVFWMHAFLVES